MQVTVPQSQELAFHPKYKGIWRAGHTKTGESYSIWPHAINDLFVTKQDIQWMQTIKTITHSQLIIWCSAFHQQICLQRKVFLTFSPFHQVRFWFHTSCFCSHVVSQCSFWRQPWDSSHLKDALRAGGTSAHCLKVSVLYISALY